MAPLPKKKKVCRLCDRPNFLHKVLKSEKVAAARQAFADAKKPVPRRGQIMNAFASLCNTTVYAVPGRSPSATAVRKRSSFPERPAGLCSRECFPCSVRIPCKGLQSVAIGGWCCRPPG